MTNTYITVQEYLRGNSGQETASLVGNVMHLSSSVVVGATSLPITYNNNTPVSFAVDDRILIFDGGSTEEVAVTVGALAGASSITVSATQYAHAAKTSLCSDGTLGSLADDIITASDMVEDEVLQPLLLTTHIDTLSLQTMEASISNDGILTIKPFYFPIQTVASMVLNSGQTTTSFDPTQASIELGEQIVKFYSLVPTGQPSGSPFSSVPNQRTKGTITLTYTSGFAYAAMPPRIKKAAVLYTSEMLSKRRNSTGAIRTMQGKRMAIYGLQGDLSGESLLVKEAQKLLKNYKREGF